MERDNEREEFYSIIYRDMIRKPATSGMINRGKAISEQDPDFNVEFSTV